MNSICFRHTQTNFRGPVTHHRIFLQSDASANNPVRSCQPVATSNFEILKHNRKSSLTIIFA